MFLFVFGFVFVFVVEDARLRRAGTWGTGG